LNTDAGNAFALRASDSIQQIGEQLEAELRTELSRARTALSFAR
jgi:hypothetical protein